MAVTASAHADAKQNISSQRFVWWRDAAGAIDRPRATSPRHAAEFQSSDAQVWKPINSELRCGIPFAARTIPAAGRLDWRPGRLTRYVLGAQALDPSRRGTGASGRRWGRRTGDRAALLLRRPPSRSAPAASPAKQQHPQSATGHSRGSSTIEKNFKPALRTSVRRSPLVKTITITCGCLPLRHPP